MYISKYGIRNLLCQVFTQNISKPIKNRSTRLPYELILNLLLAVEQTFQPCVWSVHSTNLVGFFCADVYHHSPHHLTIVSVRYWMASFRLGFFLLQLGIIGDIFLATVIFFVLLLLRGTRFPLLYERWLTGTALHHRGRDSKILFHKHCFPYVFISGGCNVWFRLGVG